MKGPIAWFARNRVAANLLMLLILISGAMTIPQIKVELFPELSADIVQISVPYPGASPSEVEEAICVRVEEAVHDVSGVKEVLSTSSESLGMVQISVRDGEDPRRVLEDVKARVDAIDTFPVDAEQPVVQELVLRQQVINVAIHGDVSQTTLKQLGERARDALTAIDGITHVVLANAPPYEISIEVSEEALRRWELTFDEVASAVRNSSLNLPGGSIKTRGGEVLLRTDGQAYRGAEFERLVVRADPGGARILLGDVARVIDGFEDDDRAAIFDGQPAVMLQVFRVGDQNALEVAASVHDYIAQAGRALPDGVHLTAWQDASLWLSGRLETLLRNGIQGLALVFAVLALFLRFRLAFWVSLGIPISFLGALWLMPALDQSINMLTLFAFIIVLGIVVDDAIIVGENIFKKHNAGRSQLEGAIEGAQEVSTPVTFAILTSVAAFVPLAFLSGMMGKFLRVLPLVIVPVLVFSWIESKLILPAHLAHGGRWSARIAEIPPFRWWVHLQGMLGAGLERFAERVYQPFLNRALHWRYLALACAVATLMVTIGLIQGGLIGFRFFDAVGGDVIVSQLTLPAGTPASVTRELVGRIDSAAAQLKAEIDQQHGVEGDSIVQHYLTSVGEQPYRTQQAQNSGGAPKSFSGSNIAEVTLELMPTEERERRGIFLDVSSVVRRLRELAGPIPGAVELMYTASVMSAGDAINVRLAGLDTDQLQAATEDFERTLAGYPGVRDIANTHRRGKRELSLSIRPEAEALGLSLGALARQVRQAYFGEEAQRIQRGRDDVRVMVRYPRQERRTLASLDELRVRTPTGAAVPFASVATLETGRGHASIQRADRQRVISVTADVDEDVEGVSTATINEKLAGEVLPALSAKYPSVHWSFQGEAKEQRETLGDMLRLFGLALFAIYGLMAIPFRSYVQPLIVMFAIPFGLVGAVAGHWLLGYDLSFLSIFGLVALAGVVVNDSLVLVDYVNREVELGNSPVQAASRAGTSRFRAIVLTSLTTFAGLTPLMLERSVQAQFLVPMAISLAFGVLFSTVISLLLIPAMYVVLDDLGRARSWLFDTEKAS